MMKVIYSNRKNKAIRAKWKKTLKKKTERKVEKRQSRRMKEWQRKKKSEVEAIEGVMGWVNNKRKKRPSKERTNEC